MTDKYDAIANALKMRMDELAVTVEHFGERLNRLEALLNRFEGRVGMLEADIEALQNTEEGE